MTPDHPVQVAGGPCARRCTGAADCLSTATRLYPCGWRCPDHTPARMAGRPEPPPGPGWPAGAWATPSPQSASALFDARAVASGKRRSSLTTYRAAQAAVRKDSSK